MSARRRLALLATLMVLNFIQARAQTAALPAASSNTAAAKRQRVARLRRAGPRARQSTPSPVMSNQIFAHVLFNQLEWRAQGPEHGFRWDGEAWIGGDFNRVWLKSEGSASRGRNSGEVEALYDRPLPRLRYFDGQIGVREDLGAGPRRTWLALGVEGLAPGFFDFEPTLYIGEGGRVAGRIAGSYNLLLTQRLVAQPQLEMNFYGSPDLPRRLGAGLSDLDTGLRLRYEISRKFAPYLGLAYTRQYGGTAAFSRQAGESVAGITLVLGLRVWY